MLRRGIACYWIGMLGIALAASPAAAVDGVKELSQACVATGCVPDDDPGFPIELNADGQYRLTGPLIVPNANTTAIAVASDYVTIDLNGFLITGVTYCTGTPVTSCAPTGTGVGISSGVQRLEVRNGIVRGFGSHGISAGNATVVDRVRIEECNGNGIHVNTNATDLVVRDSVIRRNGNSGIEMSGVSKGALISGSIVSGNKVFGIAGTKGTVSTNVVNDNGSSGLLGSGIAITGNTFSGNNAGGAQQSGGLQIGQNQCGTALCP